MKNKKITFIGGGSYQWVPILFRDIAVNPHLADSQFVLHDLNPVSNEELAAICRILARKLGSPIQIVVENDLDRAIAGAAAVILCISTGGLDAMEPDIEIPKRYGIYQTVGDSTGPGGISRTLRNVPVVAKIARRMEALCPDAWLLNLSNPMSQIVRAIQRTSRIKVAGLCHEYMGFMSKLQEWFGLEDWRSETESVIAGINHFTMITNLRIRGSDGLEMLREHRRTQNDPPTRRGKKLANASQSLSGDQVKFDLFEIYGAMPYPGDRHLAEFFPHFLSEKTNYGAVFGVNLTSIEDRRTIWMKMFHDRIKEWTSDEAKADLYKPSDESVAPILAALLEGVPTIQPVTLGNQGQVANLPADVAVETLASFDRDQIAPHDSGTLTAGLHSLILPHCLNQELTVEGAIEGNREKILQAMIADPMVNNNDFRQISKMLDELMEANRALLPQFFPEKTTVTLPVERLSTPSQQIALSASNRIL